MKVIDLIYKIANGEKVPQKIIYEDELYEFREDLHDYENEYPDFEAGIDKYKYLFEDPYGRDYKEFFNDEIEEIEEDKKIEELEQRTDTGLIGTDSVDMIEHTNRINRQAGYLSEIVSKINEIIDYINKEKKW